MIFTTYSCDSSKFDALKLATSLQFAFTENIHTHTHTRAYIGLMILVVVALLVNSCDASGGGVVADCGKHRIFRRPMYLLQCSAHALTNRTRSLDGHNN